MTPRMAETYAWLRSAGILCHPNTCTHCKGVSMPPVDGLKTREIMTRWIERFAKVTLTHEPEDAPIEGNASAIDDETDRETVAWIRDQLDSGNEWAWCTVCVTVTYNEFSAVDYLGGCSYESEAAFRTDDYFADMVHRCAVDIVSQMFAARETLDRVWELASHDRDCVTPGVTDNAATERE